MTITDFSAPQWTSDAPASASTSRNDGAGSLSRASANKFCADASESPIRLHRMVITHTERREPNDNRNTRRSTIKARRARGR
jgi:hypothetical protein